MKNKWAYILESAYMQWMYHVNAVEEHSTYLSWLHINKNNWSYIRIEKYYIILQVYSDLNMTHTFS